MSVQIALPSVWQYMSTLRPLSSRRLPMRKAVRGSWRVTVLCRYALNHLRD